MNEWVSVRERLPENDTPVLIVLDGEVKIAERRTESPSFEESWDAYDYWDDPANDGQDWHDSQVTYWMPIPDPSLTGNIISLEGLLEDE